MIDTSDFPIELLPRRLGDPLPEFDKHYRIRGELGWLLKGPPDALDASASALVGVSERISGNLLLLSFGNAVGFFDVPPLGRIEVLSGKWDRGDFDQMLAELTDIAAGLPFSATSAAALPYDRTIAAQDDILYHAFVYIRHALTGMPVNQRNLLTAFRHVLRDPYRRFARTRRSVSIDRVHHLDSTALATIAAGKGGFTRVPPEHPAHGTLARSLRGHLPDRMDELHVESTVDTPENQFVKAFLSSIGSVIGEMRRVSSNAGPSAFSKRISRECDDLDALLRPVVQHPLWQEVAPMVHLPASSPVLQRRRGYRDVYFHFAKMRLAARVPLEATLVRDLLEAKDIAQLFEIWSYFVLAREISHILGQPSHAGSPRVDALQITIPWDLECAWPDGTRLLYNPRYSRSSKNQFSYSVPLRPDVGLHVEQGTNTGLHLLDAKFKVENLSAMLSVEDSHDEDPTWATEERQGTFKRGDLYKMHAYRDAIPAARSVWIIYPGTETRFFSESGAAATTFDKLPGDLAGVGAVPLLPNSGSHSALQALLAHLLDY